MIANYMSTLFDEHKVTTLQPGVAINVNSLNTALAANSCTIRSNLSGYKDYN